MLNMNAVYLVHFQVTHCFAPQLLILMAINFFMCAPYNTWHIDIFVTHLHATNHKY